MTVAGVKALASDLVMERTLGVISYTFESVPRNDFHKLNVLVIVAWFAFVAVKTTVAVEAEIPLMVAVFEVTVVAALSVSVVVQPVNTFEIDQPVSCTTPL